jgi:RNA polymerase sigma factor (sigma-70 family)
MSDTLPPELPPSFPTQLRDLLEAADGPDQERAWAQFLDVYSRLILFVARQIPRDHDVVMDRYAFVVERLREHNCRRLRTFAADGRGKFTTWLVVVVRRLCLDHDRRKHGRAAAPGVRRTPAPPRRLVELVFDPAVLDRLPSRGPSTDEDLEREQLLQQLDAAVATLSPSDQLLLSLRHQDDRSAREIASLMSLPTPFHVYRRLNRLHDLLRQALTAAAGREPGAGGADPGPPAVQYGWSSDGPFDPTP